jgi:hypothetical protein
MYAQQHHQQSTNAYNVANGPTLEDPLTAIDSYRTNSQH